MLNVFVENDKLSGSDDSLSVKVLPSPPWLLQETPLISVKQEIDELGDETLSSPPSSLTACARKVGGTE
jgi:hypothetical protein